MADGILRLFPPEEKDKRKEINALMKDWKAEIAEAIVKQKDKQRSRRGADYFNSDGFFPHYFEQKQKVLFIGREARGHSGCDFLEDTINYYKDEDTDQKIFMRRILKMAYIIQNGVTKLSDIPNADSVAKEMVKTKKYGFAFMNISKYSNDSPDGAKRNNSMINQFIEDSHLENRNFFTEELEILEPDIIITANLWDGIKDEFMQLCFDENKIQRITALRRTHAELSTYTLNRRKIKLLDLYHFSNPGSDDEMYCQPVIDLLIKR
jgi:hypothetical protein